MMDNDINQLDLSLDDILKHSLKGISKYLIDNYTTDELHIMRRLLRQRQSKFSLKEKQYREFNHYIAIFNLAESIKRTL